MLLGAAAILSNETYIDVDVIRGNSVSASICSPDGFAAQWDGLMETIKSHAGLFYYNFNQRQRLDLERVYQP